MNIIEAVVLGLVQGLTEFIPVSSSGHLVFFHHLFGSGQMDLGFDVALHFGTLLALLLYFRKDLLELLGALFKRSAKSRQAWLLAVATLPGALAGFLLESRAESAFRSIKLVSITMLCFGLLMLLADKWYARRSSHTSLEKISKRQAIGMGIAQAVAIVPGVSRSGSTITSGLFLGLDRVSATRFSFLLGVPITAGAVLKVFLDSTARQQAMDQYVLFIIGVITAAISGLFAIRFMLAYLSGHTLSVFAYYRIALGLIMILYISLV